MIDAAMKFIDLEVIKNLEKRRSGDCDTWDESTLLTYAVGVRIDVDFEIGSTLKALAENFEELDIDLSSGESIHLCKFTVKDLKNYSTIIYRYKLLAKT